MEILNRNYKFVLTLEEFLTSYYNKEYVQVILQSKEIQHPGMQYKMCEVMVCSNSALNVTRPCNLTVTLNWAEISENVRYVKFSQMQCILSGAQSENDVRYISFPLSLSDLLHSQQWKELHNRIGTSLVRKVLLSASLFVKYSEKRVFVQVCGSPITEALRVPTPAAKKIVKPKEERKVPFLSDPKFMKKMNKLAVKRCKRKADGNPDDEPPRKQMQLDSTADEVHSENKKRKKRRKKLKRAPSLAVERLVASISKPFDLYWSFNSARICYVRNLREVWPDTHILSRLPADDMGAGTVVQDMLAYDVGNQVNADCTSQLMELLPQLKSYCLNILARHKRFRYRDHCREIIKGLREKPAAKIVKSMKSKKSDPIWNISFQRVYSFIDFILRRVIPLELFGSVSNRKLFCGFIKHFLIAGKFEIFTVAQLMYGIKVTEMKWLQPLENNVLMLYVASRVLIWLLFKFVVVAVRSFFYVTETCYKRNELMYFSKQHWQSVSDKAIRELIKTKQFEVLTKKQIQEISKVSGTPGKSILRLLPKRSCVRPILVSIGERMKKEQTSEMQLILSLFCANLDGAVTLKNKGMILKKWRGLYREWENNGRPELYYVKLDMRNAFGTIKQALLQNILCEYQKSVPQNVDVCTYLTLTFNGKVIRKKSFSFVVTKPDDFLSRHWSADTVVVNVNNTKHSIEVNAVIEAILKLVLLHVISNGKQSLLMAQGIAQGSPLSTLLCNLYYGHMDKKYLSDFLDGQGEVFMRTVDDYLFVTPARERAVRFLWIMTSGIPMYGSVINDDKTLTNVTRHLSQPTQVNPWLTFCGYQFNMRTLQTKADYESYREQNIRHTIKINCTKNPGRFLVTRMMYTSMLKIQPILLDLTFNSREQIYTNLFHAFIMASFRFHSMSKAIFFHREKHPMEKNPALFIAGITICGREIWKLLVSQHRCFALGDGEGYIAKQDVFLLLYSAFILKLSKHTGLYGGVLRCLKRLKKSVMVKVHGEQRNIINAVCERGMPRSFLVMK